MAKSVFSVHGVGIDGKVMLKRNVGRADLLPMFAQMPPCLIGMEACSGAHHFARQLRALGHDARIMAPRFVIPYRKSGKNDGNDAEAICEAVSRPNMRFVAVKSVEQQGAWVIEPVSLNGCHVSPPDVVEFADRLRREPPRDWRPSRQP